MHYLLSFFLLVAVLLSCKNQQGVPPSTTESIPAVIDTDTIPTAPAADSILLTYERTPCFGMCPVFTLTVMKSGNARFDGKNFTDMMGSYQSQWDSAALQRILFVADSIGYFSFDDQYDSDRVTDLPTITTSIMKNGYLKPVSNRYKGPRSLLILYRELDGMLENATWKPVGK